MFNVAPAAASMVSLSVYSLFNKRRSAVFCKLLRTLSSLNINNLLLERFHCILHWPQLNIMHFTADLISHAWRRVTKSLTEIFTSAGSLHGRPEHRLEGLALLLGNSLGFDLYKSKNFTKVKAWMIRKRRRLNGILKAKMDYSVSAYNKIRCSAVFDSWQSRFQTPCRWTMTAETNRKQSRLNTGA